MWPFKPKPYVSPIPVPTAEEFQAIVNQATELLFAGDENWTEPFGHLHICAGTDAHRIVIARAMRRLRESRG